MALKSCSKDLKKNKIEAICESILNQKNIMPLICEENVDLEKLEFFEF